MHDIALIGIGRIGRIHAANIAANPRLRLAAIADPFATDLTTVADCHGAAVVTAEQAIADPELDGVIIASPTDCHLDQLLAAASAGKAVLCEKPLDLSFARARAAGDRFDTLGARLLVAFNRRFDPNFSALKARIDSGELGLLETVNITSHDPAPPPLAYLKTSGGIFKDMAIHDFDMARYLLGEEVTQVFAASAVLVDPAIGDVGDADTAKVILRTPSGRLCSISLTRRSGYGYDQRIEAFCTAGMIRVANQHETTVEVWREQGVQGGSLQNFFLERYREAYVRELDHFADILDGGTPLAGYGDGVAALAIAEAASRSVRSGRFETV